MSRLGQLGHRLYTGEVSYDFVGNWKRWYTISAILIVVSIAAIAIRGLNLGVDFKGGNVVTVPTSSGTLQQARDAAQSVGFSQVEVTVLTSESGRQLQVETEVQPNVNSEKLADALAKEFNVASDKVTAQEISASWGGEITKKALTGLAVFLILIVLFLSFYFEWRMAIAAVLALLHDLLITVGIYALVGFTVTPATVIGVLTILGYSLYDTVVVFDKVRENTRGLAGSNRMTYSQAANLAVNQTLVRSINTSIIALLPVGAILVVGTALGAGPLEDLSLALFVGIATGTYSSIFIATPLAAQFKEREPAMQALAKRVAAREAAGRQVGGPTRGAKTKGPTATAAEVADEDEVGLDDEALDESGSAADVAPATAGAAQNGAPRPPAGQRPQQRRSTTKRRPSGKKRR